MKDKVLLYEQAYKASPAPNSAKYDDERQQAYWQPFQISSALGIPVLTME